MEEQIEWKQPRWFWFSIIGLILVKYLFTFILVWSGLRTGEILQYGMTFSVITFVVYACVVMYLLPKEARKDVNTLFYLFLPLIFYLPNWGMLAEIL
ncbi:hypothetical protein [Alkalibacillus haloalkaliphilus]|uniref:Uncharacterized protein n=1 Tax=Alkalibacillus haloalkaliphilus TaxID=94136 RepID=A0A511W5A9_9BACI|nr:hypothetical protein [Alkalibacillus haloalkaliphilus]GEN46286.1 hypothetical protein AHA02nite_20620 [Alkalibacillus haloalkaliphilus]